MRIRLTVEIEYETDPKDYFLGPNPTAEIIGRYDMEGDTDCLLDGKWTFIKAEEVQA